MEAKEKADILIKLLQNKEFLMRFNKVENDLSKTKELFASEGLDFSDDQLEVIVDALNAAKKTAAEGTPLTEEQMENVSGGGMIKSIAKKALFGVILIALVYGGVQIYKKVQEKGGVKNKDVLDAINKAKDVAQKAKEKIDEAADKAAEWLADEHGGKSKSDDNTENQ